jgi:cell wall-associated NlpC family hydrolase
MFTACSSKDIKQKSRAELLQIQQKNIAQLPMAKTYPIESRTPIIETNYDGPEIQEIHVIDTPNYASTYRKNNKYFQTRAKRTPYRNYRNNFYTLTKQIENESKQLLGKKYVWGATGPYTYDCSGFTQKIYRDVGINIPRVSREQARVGKYVNYHQLRKGDMVFFDTNKKRTGRVTHVGIYLGGGNFIHASSSAKKVVIFNFNEKEFYRKRFLWGRRVIQDNTRMASL